MDDAELLPTAMVVSRGAVRLVRRLHAQRPDHGVPLMQLSVLSHLHRRGPMTPTELATADGIQPKSLTRTLTALESEALIQRQPDDRDGRRSVLSLTAAGRHTLTEVLRRRDGWLAHAMATKLTPTECELLRLAGLLLERLAEPEATDRASRGGGSDGDPELSLASPQD